jgi:hypothetical protein
MKKLTAGCLIILLIAGSSFFSYAISKGRAQKVAESFPGSLSSMRTHLALYGVPELTPCWVFSAEYEDVLTGATFDVYVSLLGKVLKIPPKSKAP